MDLSRKEITTLQDSIRLRKKKLKEFHASETSKQRQYCGCETSLRLLAGLASKLADERGKETIDYTDVGVLLVDDVAFTREHTKLFLQKQGFTEIDEADDGHSAIVKIKRKSIPYGKNLPYDLVLCDLNMPTISGLDVLRLVKKETRFSRLPFIMVTGDKDKKNLVDAIESGVSDYITKPVNEEEFLTKINKVLQ